ncbi:DMT family transporter [Sporolactobacillus sp. Y61]|jgi:drug/metabolite transporter (DMT)-like permease|uniref:DMT family transporter n=1 Tax=Sporolactobacillus sp. Y61 TaxID=3160863 RepID=A0AAU8ID51_9BACL|nr:DMT family transporter [Sporolactobacillus sp. THM19-2]RYL92204.1 DMT family transporter [Sporolactobacillus sp. THM19-2]
MNLKRSLAADAGLLAVTFVWGTTFIIVQNVLDKLTPLQFNAWRFLTAAIILTCWKMCFRGWRPVSARKSVRLIGSGLLLGTFLFIGYICQTVGLLYTSASNAAFITGLSVVLVPLFSIFILKRTPGKAALAGILLAAAGLFFLTTKGQFVINRGDLIVLVCAAAFALHIIFTARVTEKYNSLSLTIIQLTAVALYSFAFGLPTDGLRILDISALLEPDIVAVILFMGVFATAFAYLFQTDLQKVTPATHVGLIFIMEPVFAAWTSVIIQHVILGKTELIGCTLILIGMLFAEWPSGKKRTEQ